MTEPNTILILAAHGSSHSKAQAVLEGFAQRAHSVHPDVPVHLAFTAIPRSSHLESSPGRSLAATLEDFAGTGVTRLLVQSLHVIAGGEWERTARLVETFARRAGIKASLGGPLLATPKDADAVARAVTGSLPDAADQPVLLMGHGTTHQSQELYRTLALHLSAMRPGTYLGVMEAHSPEDPLHIQAILARLAGRGARSARLMPLLTVAGRHAYNDLAGPGPSSWKTMLDRAGILGIPDLAGLVEREAFATLWLDRIARLIARASAD